jgi:preprotein translocase SecE subunit
LNGSIRNINQFLGQVKAEVAKIEWPSFEEFIGSTLITLVIVTCFTLFIFGVDQALKLLAQYVFTYSL